MIHGSTTPMTLLYEADPGWAVWGLIRDAVVSRLSGPGCSSAASSPWPWPTNSLIPTAWRVSWSMLPISIGSAGSGPSCRNGLRHCETLLRLMALPKCTPGLRTATGLALVKQGQMSRRSRPVPPESGRLAGHAEWGCSRPYASTQLAELYWYTGQPETGLHAVSCSDGRRHRGTFVMPRGDIVSRVSCCCCSLVLTSTRQKAVFSTRLALARRQHAKMPELRAAAAPESPLATNRGKRVEARELLAPVYSWFTEGFATADLQEARALLDELA